MSGLELQGKALLSQIKGHKEGAGEDKELAIDVKFKAVTSAAVLVYFSSTLRSLLFNPETGEPRMRNLKPLKLTGSQRNMEMRLDDIDLPAVELKGFEIDAMPGERVGLTFTATAFPTAGQMVDAWKLLGDEVEIDIKPNGELPMGEKTPPHRTSAPDKKPPAPAAAAQPDTATPKLKWPQPNARRVYERADLEIGEQCGEASVLISLLQVDEAAWVNGMKLQLPGEDPFQEPLTAMEKPFESRAVAMLDSSKFVIQECEEWAKKNKKSPHKSDVEALRAFAAKMIVGTTPVPKQKAAPKVTTRKRKTAAK